MSLLEKNSKINVTGIIIFEKKFKENSKSISILTRELGVIPVILRNSRAKKNMLGNLVQLFAYGNFILSHNNNGYILDDIEIKDLFFELRNDLKNLSLAQYFCQLSLVLRPEKYYSNEFLRVFLNSLFYLSSQKKDHRIIKMIFELRACSLSGYAPHLSSCDSCKNYDPDMSCFVLKKAKIFCQDCTKNINYLDNNCAFLGKSELFCLRHITYSPIEKLFSFSISESTINFLSDVIEKYVKFHVDFDFKSLEFYKKI